MTSLEQALIGNCTIGALIDTRATVTWACFPRFDGDPWFCSLLRDNDEIGCAAVDLAEYSHSEQYYLENTAILTTRLFDRQGGCVEVTDFAPRFGQYGRIFRPMMLVRRIAKVSGIDGIALTKLDVLDGFKTVRICVGYKLDGERLNRLPAGFNAQERLEPIWEDFEGWTQSTKGARSWAELPAQAVKYVRRVEELIECPVTLLSTSPERDDTILMKDPFLS